MDRYMFKESENEGMSSSFFQKKGLLTIIVVILLILAVSIGLFLFFPSSESDTSWKISGMLYVNNQPYNGFATISLKLNNSVFNSSTQIFVSGEYLIEGEGLYGNTGEFLVEINYIIYSPMDLSGDSIDLFLQEDMSVYYIDLFVNTIDDSDASDDDSDETTGGDDSGDDSSDDGSDNGDDSSDDGSDNGDDSSDDGDDSGDDSSDDGDDSGDDGSDGSDGSDDGDDSSDDSDDTNETDDDSDEIGTLFCSQKLSSSITGPWLDTVLVGPNENVWLNITMNYNGSEELDHVILTDILPQGILYNGNISANKPLQNITYDVLNNTLRVIIQNVTSNQSVNVSYALKVTTDGNFFHTINLSAATTSNETLYTEATNEIIVHGQMLFSSWFLEADTMNPEKSSRIEVNETIWNSIRITHVGNHSLQNISLIEILPENVQFYGNATINNISIQPTITGPLNNTLRWNISQLQNESELVYQIKPLVNGTYTILSNVTANESSGFAFSQTDYRALKVVPKNLLVISKQVRIQDGSWENIVTCTINEPVLFNITITNTALDPFYSIGVVDMLPENMSYIQDSSRIIYKNNTYYGEPTINSSTNNLLWNNLNQITGFYLGPGESLYLYIESIVNVEGISVNVVNVSVCKCSNCTQYHATASAQVNANSAFQHLQVNAGGPYTGYINENIVLAGSYTGGTPPYLVSWDLNEDSIFTDASSSTVNHQWNTTGTFNVTFRVIDSNGTIVSDITTVTIHHRNLTVDAGGPYKTYQGSQTHFQSTVSGGFSPYHYIWYFGDGNTSSIDNPIHEYSAVGSYMVTLNVTDAQNNSVQDTVLVEILPQDTTPPVIIIEEPINAIYVKQKPVFPFFTTFVFGSVNISINITEEDTGLDSVAVYINDVLHYYGIDSQFTYEWNTTCFGRYKLKIVVQDNAGNVNMMKKIIWKFF